MTRHLKLVALLSVFGLLLMALPIQAADNGNGSGSTPQDDFCLGLSDSCHAGCNAISDSTLKGAYTKRQCNRKCGDAWLSCSTGMKSGKSPVTKKKLP